MNLAMLLDMAAEAFGERTAVSCGPDHLSYTRLRSAAQAAARQLRHSACSHAALLDTNGLNAPITLFAEAFLGVRGLASPRLRHSCVRYSLQWLFRQFVILGAVKDLSWFSALKANAGRAP